MNIVRFVRILCAVTVFLVSSGNHIAHGSPVTFNPIHAVDPVLPVIAAPVDFRVILVDETRVEFSWNPVLLDGSTVDFFRVWDREQLLVETADNRWQLDGIDHNQVYDFSVSAVTESGEETRRSSRVYYDLPPQNATDSDANNQYLPPLENLQAQVIDADSVRITWDPAPAHWSWAEPSDYVYEIVRQGSRVDVVSEPGYTYTGLDGQGLVWISVYVSAQGGLSSRQPDIVLVDTSEPAGTVFAGIAGFNELYGLSAEVYSSTAAELFWKASGSPAVSHVYINGRLIARIKEGNSLFLEDLPSGQRMLMSVGEGWPYDAAPPFDWPLLHDYPLMHVWIETPPGVGNGSSPAIEPVTGLRADVYSATAAEVFWDRSGFAPARYRLYLNQQYQQETDGVSWFIDDLNQASTYTVGVSVVDVNGEETQIREITLQTRGGTENVPANCRIDGLEARVYSATAAEVFWIRQAAGQQYLVSLDDQSPTATDAVSWFMQDLAPGSLYQFNIRRSDAGCEDFGYQIDFQLKGSQDSPGNPDPVASTINFDNYVELSREVFRAFVGDDYTGPLNTVADFEITGRNPDGSFTDVYTCDSGSFNQSLNPTSTNAGIFFTFTFDSCVDDGVLRDGILVGQDGSRGLSFDADQFSVTGPDGRFAEYSGEIQIFDTQTASFDEIRSFDTSNVMIKTSAVVAEQPTLAQMNTSFAYGSRNNGLDQAWLRGSFAARLNTVDGSILRVSTPVEFSYALNTRTDGTAIDGLAPTATPISNEQRNAWTFTQGQLSVIADDGSALLLDADTGNPDTVIITIQSADGEEIFEQRWSIWRDDLRFTTFPDISR